MSRDCRARFKGISMTALLVIFACTAAARDADVMDALDAGWAGVRRCEKLHEDDYIRVLRCTFPPNVGHERHSHPASFAYVLSGGHVQITDATGTRQLESKTDQYMANKPVEWHEGLNTGDTTLRYLIVEKKYPTEK
jgi:quercetin dioxygenase-like cupin family protein